MRTEIQYGVHYFSSRTVLPMPNESSAYRWVDKLREAKVPAEVLCRRVTYGAWVEPKVRLLNGG